MNKRQRKKQLKQRHIKNVLGVLSMFPDFRPSDISVKITFRKIKRKTDEAAQEREVNLPVIADEDEEDEYDDEETVGEETDQAEDR